MTPSTGLLFASPESPTMTTARCSPRGRPGGTGTRWRRTGETGALFSRRNFTNLIDRGKRTREIIDFLLRPALAASSSLVAFFVSRRMGRRRCFPRAPRLAAIDRVRTQRENLHYELHNLFHRAKWGEWLASCAQLVTLSYEIKMPR